MTFGDGTVNIPLRDDVDGRRGGQHRRPAGLARPYEQHARSAVAGEGVRGRTGRCRNSRQQGVRATVAQTSALVVGADHFGAVSLRVFR